MARTLNTVAIVAVLALALPWGVQWLRAPWSLSALGPTLTGAWNGPLQTRLGAEYRIHLSLEYQGRVDRRSNLAGRARICSRHGEIYEYAIDGEASRSGDTVRLSLTSVDPAPSALGTTLEGSWSGQGLTLRPLSNPFLPDDSFSPAQLTRGDLASFLIACGRLASSHTLAETFVTHRVTSPQPLSYRRGALLLPLSAPERGLGVRSATRRP